MDWTTGLTIAVSVLLAFAGYLGQAFLDRGTLR